MSRGTIRELGLAVRALQTARTHIRQALCGLKGKAYERAVQTSMGLAREVALLKDVPCVSPHKQAMSIFLLRMFTCIRVIRLGNVRNKSKVIAK